MENEKKKQNGRKEEYERICGSVCASCGYSEMELRRLIKRDVVNCSIAKMKSATAVAARLSRVLRLLIIILIFARCDFDGVAGMKLPIARR